MAIVEAIYCHCVPLLPHRLNYPCLVPRDRHTQCLYRRDRLGSLLMRHLNGQFDVCHSRLRQHVAQFDWRIQAPLMDRELARMAAPR